MIVSTGMARHATTLFISEIISQLEKLSNIYQLRNPYKFNLPLRTFLRIIRTNVLRETFTHGRNQ